jgi:hypothetical protein
MGGGEMKFISLEESPYRALMQNNTSGRIWVNVESILAFHRTNNGTAILLSNLGSLCVEEDPAEILEKIKEAK